MTNKDPFTSDIDSNGLKTKKTGSTATSILLVFWYIILAILGIGVLAFVALFVVCMV